MARLGCEPVRSEPSWAWLAPSEEISHQALLVWLCFLLKTGKGVWVKRERGRVGASLPKNEKANSKEVQRRQWAGWRSEAKPLGRTCPWLHGPRPSGRRFSECPLTVYRLFWKPPVLFYFRVSGSCFVLGVT